MKLNYLVVPALALLLAGCQTDEGEPSAGAYPDEQEMQEQFQPGESSANIDVSDAELEKFVEVSSTVQEIQMESQMEMVAIVEEEGLEVETYNQIAEVRHLGEDEDQLNVSTEDMEKFESASESIAVIEQDLENKMEAAMEEEGMEMQRFMAINTALQQDPSLQQRVREMMTGNQMQPQTQQDREEF